MNINDYRRGMDQILPDTDLKERIMNQTKKKPSQPAGSLPEFWPRPCPSPA